MQAQQSITIHAPLQVVWSTLTDIESWPRWQKAVSAAVLEGELEPSGKFVWRSAGMTIRSRIEEIIPPVAIRWSGRAPGTCADHAWSLESSGNDTQVTTTEHMSGWLVAVIGLFSKTFLENALNQALAELKQESERRHAA